MRKEDALRLSEKAVSELAEALASGRSEALTNYLDVMSRFHRYSIGNCILIACQRPTATHIAGFSAWKKIGRSVRKGEKGICILAPMIRKKESEESETKAEKELFGYRTTHVFDIAQTEGEELPDLPTVEGDPGELLDKLKGVISRRGISLAYASSLGGAEGVSRGGAITILSSLTAAQEFAVLAHELAHEMLHSGKIRSALSKKVKELEAEATAYVVAKASGLENTLRQSADYIQLYEGDKQTLMESLGRICSVSSSILADMEATTAQDVISA